MTMTNLLTTSHTSPERRHTTKYYGRLKMTKSLRGKEKNKMSEPQQPGEKLVKVWRQLPGKTKFPLGNPNAKGPLTLTLINETPTRVVLRRKP